MENQNTNQHHNGKQQKLFTNLNISYGVNAILLIALIYLLAQPAPTIEDQVRVITQLNKNTHDHLQLIKQSAEWTILKK